MNCVDKDLFHVPILQFSRAYSAGLLRPKRMKYRKSQKNIRAVLPVVPEGGVVPPKVAFGEHGIYAKESIRLRANQIEATRMALVRAIGKKGTKLWIRVFPHIPVTKKPLESRMGKGKGAVDHFIANVKAGRMLFEFNCPDDYAAKLAFKQANYKLPIPVGYVRRPREGEGEA